MSGSTRDSKEDLLKKLLIASLLSIIFTINVYAQPMYVTCYCPESCPGTIAYSGVHVREGIAAVTEEHIGDIAIVYTTDGEFIGRFECLDKIGTGKKTVIDIWKPNLKSAKELMKKTEGKVEVTFIAKEELK